MVAASSISASGSVRSTTLPSDHAGGIVLFDARSGARPWERYTPTSHWRTPATEIISGGDTARNPTSAVRPSTPSSIRGAVTLVLPQNVVERLGLEQRGYRVRYVRRRTQGGTAAGGSGDGPDRQPFHEHGLCRRPATQRAAARPDRPRGSRSDRRLHESHAHSTISRLSAAQAEVVERSRAMFSQRWNRSFNEVNSSAHHSPRAKTSDIIWPSAATLAICSR